MKSGVILIDKPVGITSAGVVARVKRILGATRVGHAGTLDPGATGLLIVLVNGATKVASYAADGLKVYSGEMRLGVTTSTDDMEGEVLARSEQIPSWSAVTDEVRRWVGRIRQVPPRVSAIKVGGKRAHAMQRKGESFELAAREVEVRRFEVQPGVAAHEFRYEVECGPGTYIRSLARDVGEALGCGGAVASLRRESSGHFSVRDAVSLENVGWEHVRDWRVLVPHLPVVSLPGGVVTALLNGQPLGLIKAWECWGTPVESANAPRVVFSREGTDESLGLLRIHEQGRFEFELNIHPPRR